MTLRISYSRSSLLSKSICISQLPKTSAEKRGNLWINKTDRRMGVPRNPNPKSLLFHACAFLCVMGIDFSFQYTDTHSRFFLSAYSVHSTKYKFRAIITPPCTFLIGNCASLLLKVIMEIVALFGVANTNTGISITGIVHMEGDTIIKATFKEASSLKCVCLLTVVNGSIFLLMSMKLE